MTDRTQGQGSLRDKLLPFTHSLLRRSIFLPFCLLRRTWHLEPTNSVASGKHFVLEPLTSGRSEFSPCCHKIKLGCAARSARGRSLRHHYEQDLLSTACN
jgi:hypothetical protein